ncbi:MAG TPA: hypothetical protein VFN61_06785 [Acidimicrobiales bacterium]|nr:hypothetical protein [Acidimicrobiales bacterium]
MPPTTPRSKPKTLRSEDTQLRPVHFVAFPSWWAGAPTTTGRALRQLHEQISFAPATRSTPGSFMNVRWALSPVAVVALLALPTSRSDLVHDKANIRPTPVTATVQRTITLGSFAIEVPASWVLRPPIAASCHGAVTRPEIVAGPMGQALAGCGVPVVRQGLFAVFAHGGPLAVPIISAGTYQVHVVNLNGISVTTMSGNASVTGAPQSYVLAMLDGWDNWLLLVGAPGRHSASQEAEDILKTVHVRPGRRVTTATPVPEKFLGTWSHGPDQSLVVGRNSLTEDTGSAAGCTGDNPPLGCHIRLRLRVATAVRSSLTATVTQVKAYRSPTQFVLNPPLTPQLAAEGALRVGTRLTFTGIAPGMLVEQPGQSRQAFLVEWPYWCQYGQETPAEHAVTDYCD